MVPNPFVELVQETVATTAILAYAFALLGITILLAGRTQDLVLWLANAWEHRHNPNKYGPRWEYVPPWAIYWRTASVCILAAAELLLIGGIAYIFTL